MGHRVRPPLGDGPARLEAGAQADPDPQGLRGAAGRGALIAIEAFIDDARRHNTFGLFMSLMMLIEFGDAFDFTAADFRQWCSAAGFSRFETIPLEGPSSAVVAYKDAR